MNLPKLSELSPYYTHTDLLEKVVEQVKKDFDWFSFEIKFTGKEDITPYQELYNQILPLIEDYCKNDQNQVIDVIGDKLSTRLSGDDFKAAIKEFI